MRALQRALEALFGHGDDDFPLWLSILRVHILIWAACTSIATVGLARRIRASRAGAAQVASLTALGVALRFAVVPSNLMDFGGIPYSRLLVGYRGFFATAQAYSLVYRWTARDLEHGILAQPRRGHADRAAVYALCRLLTPADRLPAVIAAGFLAIYPLHALLSALGQPLHLLDLPLRALVRDPARRDRGLWRPGVARRRRVALRAARPRPAHAGPVRGRALPAAARVRDAAPPPGATPGDARHRRVATGVLLCLYAWQSAAADASFRESTTFGTGSGCCSASCC